MTFRLKHRLQSFGNAFSGIATIIRTQHNAWIHLVATIGVVVSAVLYDLTKTEWLWLIVAMVLVWLAEAMNTAIEFLGDAITRENNEWIGKAKDAAAGGVLLACMGAACIGLVVFYPYFIGDKGRADAFQYSDDAAERHFAETETMLYSSQTKTSVCAAIRFWTPHHADDAKGSRRQARIKLHNVLIAFGGGYTRLDVNGGWRNPQRGQVETEPGHLYEVFATTCDGGKHQMAATVAQIRKLLTSERFFDQEAVFITTMQKREEKREE